MLIDDKLCFFNDTINNTNIVYSKFGDEYQGVSNTHGDAITTGGILSGTVTSLSGTLGPFAGMGIGDIISLDAYGARSTLTVITAIASNDSITVSPTVNIPVAGTTSWSSRKKFSGTGADDGWFLFHKPITRTLWIQAPTVQATGGITLTVQGRPFSPPTGQNMAITLFSKNYAAGAVINDRLMISEMMEALRVGLSQGVANTGDSVTVKVTTRTSPYEA